MSNAKARTKAWRVRDDDFYELESRAAELEFLLQYAILAPSGHNTQPWSFKITSEGVEVYADDSRAMPILDPTFPGNSYLLYKLLASHDTPLENPPDPVEVDRLRRSLVVGMPMPPSTAQGAFLRAGEAEWISVWLAQGAPTPVCP